jgi:2'-5' RNA ligase
MLSFKHFLIEAAKVKTGNYVSVDVTLPEDFKELIKPKTGTIVPPEKHHVTVIYSENSNEPMHKVRKICESFGDSFEFKTKQAAAFDDLPKEGERDENKATLVIKLSCPEVEAIHEELKKNGLSHSYPEFSQHVSLVYGMDKDECLEMVKSLNESTTKKNFTIQGSGFNINPIIKNWGSTL